MIETMIVLLPGQACGLARFALVRVHKRPRRRHPRQTEADTGIR
jgi:hypothetical protein